MSSDQIDGAFDVKYAPTKLADVVFSDTYAKDQIDRYVNGLTLKPLLLYGPYGTGKSAIAELLPFAMVPTFQNHDRLWLVGDGRKNFAARISAIENFAPLAAINSAGMRVVVIDEIDNMDASVQRSLKGHLDQFSKVCLFILTTNNLSKVDGGVRSRCKKIHIGKASPAAWAPRMRKILKAENVPVPSNQHLLNIAAASKGDCRELLVDLEEFVFRFLAQPTPPKPTRPKVLLGGKAKK